MAQTVKTTELLIGDIIDFNIYGNGTLNNVRNGILIGITSGIALRNPTEAAVNHANVYPAIPITDVTIPNNYTKYSYLVIQLVDNSIVEVGIPWINPVSLTRLVRKTLTVVIQDFDDNELPILQELLRVNGYLNLITTIV